MTAFYLGKRVWLLGICMSCFSCTLFAQKKYGLAELVEASHKYLPLLLQKQAQVKSAQASVTDIKQSFLPQVKFSEQLNLGSDNSLAGSFFAFGMTPSTSAGVRSQNTLQAATGNVAVLYSEYELLNFGLNRARTDFAESLVGLQMADQQREQFLVDWQVAKLYFAILKSQYRLDADRQNVNRYDSIFTVIRALTNSGLKAGADSSLAKAELSKTKIIYNQTLGLVNQLKEQLHFYTGIAITDLSVDSLANRFLIHTPVPMPVTQAPGNPLLDFYIQKRNLYMSKDQLIHKSYLPKIMLAGSVWGRGSSIQYNDKFTALSNGLGYQRFNYALGVAFTYNLFNGMYRKTKLTINKFDTEASNYELQQQQNSLLSASRQTDAVLQTIQANLSEYPVQLESALATYRQKLAQYRAGLISLIDLTNASFVLYRSQTDYIEAVSDWYLAQLNKAALNGNLNQFIQTLN
ncbi:MAG TPA: TolC family protein [Sediminibacterium sp.]